ncbi:MAG: hypothetical protein JNM09_00995 [Blastocatellia bacterium]|nr:hypothetical protein [Blastocatellia bacterium]
MTTIAIGQQPRKDRKRYTLVNFSPYTLQQIRQFLRIGESGLPCLEVGPVDRLIEDETQAVRQFQRHQKSRKWGYLLFVLVGLLLLAIGYWLKGGW